MRGWPLGDAYGVPAGVVVPARAGLAPSEFSSSSSSPCGPRACGVGPAVVWHTTEGTSWSPRVRGWPPTAPAVAAAGPVVPARAGLAPIAFNSAAAWPGGPRACGVGPPRARHPCPRRTCGPRACGVGPKWIPAGRGRPPWSPRVRGWSPGSSPSSPSHGVVPAHAGLSREVAEAVRRPRHTTVAPHDCRRAGATDHPCSGRGKRHRGDKPLPPVRTGPAGPRRGQGGDPRRGPHSGGPFRALRIPASSAGPTSILLPRRARAGGQRASIVGSLVLKGRVSSRGSFEGCGHTCG